MENREFLSLIDQLGDLSVKKISATILKITEILHSDKQDKPDHPLKKKYTNLNYGENVSADLNYLLTRIINGVASTSQEQKHGFFMLFCHILRVFPNINIENLLATVEKETEILKSDGKLEKKNALLGRLLCYRAIICADRQEIVITKLVESMLNLYHAEDWTHDSIAQIMHSIKIKSTNALGKQIYVYAAKNKILQKMYENAKNFNLIALAKCVKQRDLSAAEQKFILDPLFDKNKIGQFKTLYNTLLLEKSSCYGIRILLSEMEDALLEIYWKSVVEPFISKKCTTKAEQIWKENFLLTHLNSISNKNCVSVILSSPITTNAIIEILTVNSPLQSLYINILLNAAKKNAEPLINAYFNNNENSMTIKKYGKLFSEFCKAMNKESIDKYICSLIKQLEEAAEPKEKLEKFLLHSTTLLKNVKKMENTNVDLCKKIMKCAFKFCEPKSKSLYNIAESMLSIPVHSVIALFRMFIRMIDVFGRMKFSALSKTLIKYECN